MCIQRALITTRPCRICGIEIADNKKELSFWCMALSIENGVQLMPYYWKHLSDEGCRITSSISNWVFRATPAIKRQIDDKFAEHGSEADCKDCQPMLCGWVDQVDGHPNIDRPDSELGVIWEVDNDYSVLLQGRKKVMDALRQQYLDALPKDITELWALEVAQFRKKLDVWVVAEVQRGVDVSVFWPQQNRAMAEFKAGQSANPAEVAAQIADTAMQNVYDLLSETGKNADYDIVEQAWLADEEECRGYQNQWLNVPREVE